MQLWTFPHHEIHAWALLVYTAGSFTAFIYVAGAWSWFGRIIRFSFPMFMILAAVSSFPVGHGEFNIATLLNVESVISFCVGTTFLVFTVLALMGRRLTVPSIDLKFPFRGGTYIVGQGGSTQMVNHHSVSPSQRYGMDILKLNSAGLRANGFYPADLKRYAIWGAEVVSPWDGLVTAIVDGLADLVPPERDPTNRAGNYIALECNSATIYLCHLMNGTIGVKPGERVHVGQTLGRVGNSGNTTEPHLHIHAEKGPYPGQFSGKPGIPIRFDGRFLVRNDLINTSV